MTIKYSELKKYVMPTIIVFIVITIFNIIFHGMVMGKLYMTYSQYFRNPDIIHKHKYLMWIANLIYSFAFCYIYSKGHEKKEDALSQGTRFGLWVSLLIWVPQAIISYTVYPYPAILQVRWLAGYTIQSLIAGMTAAKIFSKVK